MVDLFHDAVTWLDGVRNTSLSQSIFYQRGAEELSLSATITSTSYEVISDDGAALRARSVDFLITTVSLIFGGERTDPQLGDQILLIVDGSVITYEVLDLEGLGHFRPNDPYDKVVRVHTKQVATRD